MHSVARCAIVLLQKNGVNAQEFQSEFHIAMTYCEYISRESTNEVHRVYHDTEYGFPLHDDDVLFERLVLEINQAGLSWESILKKREGFTDAYSGFNLARIAAYGDEDFERLMSDARIIRNRLKIRAAINNANVILGMQKEHGSFKAWLDEMHPLNREEWTKLFKKTFKFTGGEIVNEFLTSTGYLPGAHEESCPVFKKISALDPPWQRAVD
jgi:DNA-3-methyladenine glycosylase I